MREAVTVLFLLLLLLLLLPPPLEGRNDERSGRWKDREGLV